MRARSTAGALLIASLAAGCAGRAGGTVPASASPSAAPPAAVRSAAAPLPAPRVGKIVHSERGAFDLVLVVEEGDLRYLRFGSIDGDDQSVVSLSDPFAVPMEYIRYAAIGLAYTRGRARTLMVGLGGGTFTTLLRRLYPSMWIDVVDIDPVVVNVAKRFFGVKEDDRYKIHIADGRAWVEASKDRYDLVLLDAFSGDGIPAHLGERGFFEAAKARLAPGGAVVANIAADDIVVQNALVAAFLAAFPSHACFQTPDRGNLVLVGTDVAPPGRDELRTRARELTEELRLPFTLAEAAERLGTGCT